jgi:AraC-like DNA-binding protein
MKVLHEEPPLGLSELPYEVYAHRLSFRPHSRTAAHTHSWGQLDFASDGVLELFVNGQSILSPHQYALWIPPHVEHGAFTTQHASFNSIYLSQELSAFLPRQPCTLVLTPVITAVVDELIARKVANPQTDKDRRLIAVLLDQIYDAQTADTYLPYAESLQLRALLDYLRENPGDKSGNEKLAARVNMTERTLSRLCQRELGMSLGQWRQRLRFVAAVSAIERSGDLNTIADELGFSSLAAFSTAFKQFSGSTPAAYRKQFFSRGA